MFLDFREIPQIPLLIKDFLNPLHPNIGASIFSVEAIKTQIERKKKHFSTEKRKQLHHQLSHQLAPLKLSELQFQNLENLKSEKTFCITTGHQLNLFTGPVFFIYKLLQCIKTCHFLKEKFPDYNFVPLFWMATEDHDFQEIKSFTSFGKTYQMNCEQGGAVGRIVLNDLSFVQEFQKDNAFAKHFKELNLLLLNVFKKGKTLAEISQSLVHELFTDYGLLMIDGDDAVLKRAMISVFKKEVLDEELFQKTKKKRQFLEKNYGKTQVNPREINLFYLSETRNRLVKKNKIWEVLGTDIKFAKEALLVEIENHPERFSPNALMRPLYQEQILPNLAYIGGNSEIMYWLELPDYFEAQGVPFPILIPRQSLVFLKKKLIKKLHKTTLDLSAFFGDKQQVIRSKLLKNQDLLTQLNILKSSLQDQFNHMALFAETSEITFGNMVLAEKKRQLKSFDRLEKRVLRSEKIKQQEWLLFVNFCFEQVHPNGSWQERMVHFSEFFLPMGKDWFDICYEQIDMENSGLKMIPFN